jgi:hypothetical protein
MGLCAILMAASTHAMVHTRGTIVRVVVVIGRRSAVAVAEKSEIERVVLIDFAILRPHLHALVENSSNVARAGQVAHLGPHGRSVTLENCSKS